MMRFSWKWHEVDAAGHSFSYVEWKLASDELTITGSAKNERQAFRKARKAAKRHFKLVAELRTLVANSS